MSRPPRGSGTGRTAVPVLPAARFAAYAPQRPAGSDDGPSAVPLPDGRVALAVGSCAVVLDPTDGAVEVPPGALARPLVVTSDGEVHLLGDRAGGEPAEEGGWTRYRIGPGDVLLLHGDGDGDGDGGAGDGDGRPHPGGPAAWADATRLTAVVGEVVADRAPAPGDTAADGSVVERVCRRVPVLLRAGGWRSDVHLLGVQLVAPVPALALDLPADPGVRETVRLAVQGWCRAVGACPAAGERLSGAVDELVRNAAEHAGLGVTVQVQVRAGLDVDGVATVTVTDDGAWTVQGGTRADRPPGVGSSAAAPRGLDRVRGLVDEVAVVPGPLGTTVTVRTRLDGSSWPQHT